MRIIATMSTILALVACETQGPGNIYDGPAFGRLGGSVVDLDGDPLANVEVEAQGIVALTNADGSFLLDGIEPGASIIVEFEKSGYARSYINAAVISWETAAADTTLMEIDGSDTFDALAGGQIRVGEVEVDFAPSSIVDALGNSYTGIVTVEVTHVDPYTNELAGAPGDLTALAFGESGASKDAVEPAQLISYGMADISLFDEEGEPLDLEEGETAAVSMPITNPEDLGDYVQLAAGDRMATWSFDTNRGRWMEEGEGAVTRNEDGNLTFDFDASHFSWWNCDQGNVPTCATGRVIDYLGYPIRGAQVLCEGGLSNSMVYTDEDGYYVCTVLVGDTVEFSGNTFVAQRSWQKSVGQIYLYGYGDSAADCQPIPTIEIDVCRVTGAVNIENARTVIDEGADTEADHLSATFWAPRGYPEYCENPWNAVDEGQCLVMSADDTADYFPQSAMSGLPIDRRSVGSWLSISTPRNSYRLDRDSASDGTPFYNWSSHTGSGTNVSMALPDIQGGDMLDVATSGDASDYMGAWNESRFATVPSQVSLRDLEFVESNGASGVSLKYAGANNDSRGIVAFSSVADSDTNMLCRFRDNGVVNLPASALSQMDKGWGGVGIYHMEDAHTLGPDGMPIRLQVFSGASTALSIR